VTDVAVSAYPEKHPDSPDWDSEIAALKRKVDAGADRAITQFFFDNDLFEAYVERVRRAGIAIPIVPGIMPIHRFAAVCSFAERCGTSIPPALTRRFQSLEPDGEAHHAAAVELAAEQIADLMDRGVRHFHLYTLNRAELSESVCEVFAGHSQREQAAAA
jgi:methylenetetrahydrofolate reductase (NADPH)